MKRPIKVLLLFVIVLSGIAGCHEAARIDPHFIGVWGGSDGTYSYKLSINQRSDGYWEQDNNGRYQSAQGIAKLKNNKLLIGLRSFVITEYPTQDSSGIWHMQLDNVTYAKQ